MRFFLAFPPLHQSGCWFHKKQAALDPERVLNGTEKVQSRTDHSRITGSMRSGHIAL